jgi:hypothetical protein
MIATPKHTESDNVMIAIAASRLSSEGVCFLGGSGNFMGFFLLLETLCHRRFRRVLQCVLLAVYRDHSV